MDKNCWESSPSLNYHRKDKCDKLSAEVSYGQSIINLYLDKDGLTWKDNNGTQLIKYQHITNVKRSKRKPEICVNYLAKSSDSILLFQRFKIKFKTNDASEIWSKSISKQIKKSFKRIKSLVIIIDKIPNRCKLDGQSVFNEYMCDIIKELKIIYVIKELNCIKDLDDLEQLFDSMKSSDGIIIMSGDETASSLISNIINLFQTDDCCVKHVYVPFTIIPIGFHNDISRSVWRNENIQNIFLNIFLCDTFQADILSIKRKETKNRIWGFNCHYGYYSILEKYRLVNSEMKENILMKKALKKMKSFDCAIQVKLSTTSIGHSLDDTVCSRNCPSCTQMNMSVTNTPIYKLNSSTQSAITDSETYESMRDSNGISWIVINSIPCRNEMAENAFTPACHFNDGSADVILVKSASSTDIKKYLRWQKIEGTHLKLPFVVAKRIEDIHITIKINSMWSNGTNKSDLESPMMKGNRNDIVIIEGTDTSSSSDQEDMRGQDDNQCSKQEPIMTTTTTNKKKINKLFRPVMKACKDLTRSSSASQGTDDYKKPNILESDKERERKAEKQRKKHSEFKKFESSWMLDYNFIDDVNSSINIKVHSGVISFFGDAMV